MDQAVAHQDAGERHFGSSVKLVKQMFAKGQFQPWTYTPLLGGFAFAMATIILRKNPKALLATNGSIGLSTIAMANGVATSAIVKERSHA
jgi:predicted O-methyltransferase YrrM